MFSSAHQLPTLGQFNKIICDGLGLWSSDKKDIMFEVPATERERVKALNAAFIKIQEETGTYGTINDIQEATIKLAPNPKEKIRKNRTIQDYTNHYSKEDFFSFHEFYEFKQYIKIVIEDTYRDKNLSNFIVQLHESSINYFREFSREHALKFGKATDSYAYFIDNILVNLTKTLVDETASNAGAIIFDTNEWPLRSFVDSVIDLCSNTSLYKLHQFHNFQFNNPKCSNIQIWNTDLSSNDSCKTSKQVINRLKRKSKIKWDTFYETIEPLACLLPESISKDTFTLKAYSAFFIHNITNLHRKNDIPKPTIFSSLYPTFDGHSCALPISDKIDLLLNAVEEPDDVTTEEIIKGHLKNIKMLRVQDSSLLNSPDFPNASQLLYSLELPEFSVKDFCENLDKIPLWLDEWNLARCAVTTDDSTSTLQHYKNALEGAKYSSGPLFVYLYIEICAFCKHQYKTLKNRNEEDLFERFYDPLGNAVTRYAMLLGYIPSHLRDPKNLMPKVSAPVKNGIILHKIDSMATLLM